MIEALNSLIKNGTRKSINQMEKLITDILVKNFEKKKVEYENLTVGGKAQIYLKNGFKNFINETIIEVKLYQYPSGMYKFTERELEADGTSRIDALIRSKHKIRNVIYVINSDIYDTSLTLQTRIKVLKEKYQNVNLEFLNICDLMVELEDYKEELKIKIASFDEDRFKSEITEAISKTEGWKEKREELLREVNQRFISDDLVLFLGSGVSIDAGIPRWNKLITDMFINYLEIPLEESKVTFSDEEKKKIVEYFLTTNDGAPTLQAMYIKTMGKSSQPNAKDNNEKIYKELLHRVLYSECRGSSKLLDEIVEFCRPIRHGNGLYSIVTYNFDDLVEQNLKKSRVKYHSIFSDFDLPKKSELPIYHVHGFLPQNIKDLSFSNESHLVFTQDEYHKLYYDHYHWANLVQINLLKEKSCVFIGLSMTDPNLRRMLDLSKPNDGDNELERKHYAVLERDKLKTSTKKGIKKSHIEIFENSNQRVRELYFEGLGVNVIWYDKYEEIPEILKKIRDNG